MRRASIVALVRPWRPVLDERFAGAAASARTQLREEPLVRAWAQFRQRGEGLLTEGGHDEVVDQQGVAGAGARLDLVTGQPLGQQHTQRDIRPHRGVIGNLSAEPIAQSERVGFGRGRPGEDQLPTGGRVDPTENPHLEPRAALTDAGQIGRLALSAGHGPARQLVRLGQSMGQRSGESIIGATVFAAQTLLLRLDSNQ
jgi:hypothetical protein